MKSKILIVVSVLAMMLLASCAAQSTKTTPSNTNTAALDLPATANYQLDTAQSILRYGAYRLTGNGHEGNVAIQSGSLSWQDGAFNSGSFVIDMTQITDDSGSERFIEHIKNEDFFNVAAYPTARLELTSLRLEQGSIYQATADLSILGVTNEISFPIEFSQREDALYANAEFEIDRTRWGIVYDSGSIFQELGDRAIKDEIAFTVESRFELLN